MHFDLILKNVFKYVSLTNSEQEHFTSLLEVKKIKAKEFLLKAGEISQHSAFVVSGCLRGYSIDKNGFEHILTFAPTDWWIGDLYSMQNEKPGNLNIQSMVDSEVLLLSKINQEKLFIEVPMFERFFRILIEKSLVAYQQRLMENLSLTAEERYFKFCITYPTLINTIPQKYIAAYIGVTPEFLSKLKAKALKRGKMPLKT